MSAGTAGLASAPRSASLRRASSRWAGLPFSSVCTSLATSLAVDGGGGSWASINGAANACFTGLDPGTPPVLSTRSTLEPTAPPFP